MNPKLKKYLSCIILILLCLIGATVLYVSASGVWQKSEEPSETETDSSADTETNASDTQVSTDSSTEGQSETETDSSTQPEEIPAVVTIDMQGTILSEYLSSSSLRAEWAIIKNEGEGNLYLSVELYLDKGENVLNAGEGVLTVNGEETKFNVQSNSDNTCLLATYTSSVGFSEGDSIDISARLNVNINENGVTLSELSLNGTIVPSEQYKEMASSYLISIG